MGNCLGVNVQSVKIGRRSITPILSDDCLPVMITSDSRNNKKAVSLDSFFLGTARHSLCHYQSDETRDTRPVTNAGSAKHMVHSPCQPE